MSSRIHGWKMRVQQIEEDIALLERRKKEIIGLYELVKDGEILQSDLKNGDKEDDNRR